MDIEEPNMRRAYAALRELGACIVVERLAAAITGLEKLNGRALTAEELERLALSVHENTTGEKIYTLFTLDTEGALT